MTGSGAWALAIIVLINTLFIAAIAGFLWYVNRKLGELAAKVDPLAARAEEILGRVERIAADVEQKAHRVLDQTTTLVENVSQKVDTTTAIAEETISQPLIGAASVMAGINRGLQAYREQTEEKGDTP